jgi:hypothetical protein
MAGTETVKKKKNIYYLAFVFGVFQLFHFSLSDKINQQDLFSKFI